MTDNSRKKRGMSAREIIADGIVKETGVSLATIRADAAISALTAAGYRIVGPGCLDGETLEASAKWHEQQGRKLRATRPGLTFAHNEYADAIRALRASGGEDLDDATVEEIFEAVRPYLDAMADWKAVRAAIRALTTHPRDEETRNE